MVIRQLEMQYFMVIRQLEMQLYGYKITGDAIVWL